MSFTDNYVYFWNIRSLGKGQLMKLLDLLNLNFILLILIYLKLDAAESGWLIFVVAFVLETLGVIGGVFLDKKYKLIHSEQKFANRRNPELQEILSRLRRIEAKMDK